MASVFRSRRGHGRIGSLIGLVSHPEFATGHPTGGHPERPERLQGLHRAFPSFVEARAATLDEVCAVHDPDYVELVHAVSLAGRTARLDPDTICTPSSYRVALLAAGAAIQATASGGFALVRPPGHHALPDRAMGFCLFNNVVVATRFAQRELSVTRIAILDWDVHHGNGTQAMVADDSSVLYVSLHRWPFYPGSGGPGDGNATTVNIPLPAGAGDDTYVEAFEQTVEPAIGAFEPELLLVSAGFDAAAGDPLGGMRVTAGGFRELGLRARALAPRVACILEGGYDVDALPMYVEAALDGLGD